uniref:Ribonuclease H-like domain-containing protein n=1 Tax=Tanacetum cinerariifolium TaxID=118510 RepID=A0A6L2NJG4_TANCI|nr:ribonuclease H-like domain-containing protein [Tanacetum cinerariifolium]
MIGNKFYLTNFEAFNDGFVSFGDGKGRISGKAKIKTGKLDFDDVYFCKELKYNLFSVSQMCEIKNNVLFTDTECLVLSSNFKLLDESQVLPRVPRKDNIYSVDLKSVVPTGGLTCLFAKATLDESNLWHRRVGHINFKTMNKLVKGNLGETSGILKTFITGIENQLDSKVKVFRSDNETEFKNSVMTQFFDDKVVTGNQTNGITETKEKLVACQDEKKKELEQEYIPIPICTTSPLISQDTKDGAEDAGKKAPEVDASEALDNGRRDNQVSRSKDGSLFPQDRQTEHNNSTNDINTVSPPVSTAGPSFVNATS